MLSNDDILGTGSNPLRKDEIEELVCCVVADGARYDVEDRALAFPLPWPYRMRDRDVKRRILRDLGDPPRPWPPYYCDMSAAEGEGVFGYANTVNAWSMVYDTTKSPEANMRALCVHANTVWAGEARQATEPPVYRRLEGLNDELHICRRLLEAPEYCRPGQVMDLLRMGVAYTHTRYEQLAMEMRREARPTPRMGEHLNLAEIDRIVVQAYAESDAAATRPAPVSAQAAPAADLESE